MTLSKLMVCGNRELIDRNSADTRCLSTQWLLVVAGLLLASITVSGCAKKKPPSGERSTPTAAAPSRDTQDQAKSLVHDETQAGVKGDVLAPSEPHPSGVFDQTNAAATSTDGSAAPVEANMEEPAKDGSSPGQVAVQQKPAQEDMGTVQLAGGTVLHLKKWGETYDAYEWKPAITLDDPSVETVVETGPIATPFVVDPEAGKLYWIWNARPARIMRCDLDGSHQEELVTGLKNGIGLSIDPKRNKMYWVDLRRGQDKGAYQSSINGGDKSVLSIAGRGVEDFMYATGVDVKTGNVYVPVQILRRRERAARGDGRSSAARQRQRERVD